MLCYTPSDGGFSIPSDSTVDGRPGLSDERLIRGPERLHERLIRGPERGFTRGAPAAPETAPEAGTPLPDRGPHPAGTAGDDGHFSSSTIS